MFTSHCNQPLRRRQVMFAARCAQVLVCFRLVAAFAQADAGELGRRVVLDQAVASVEGKVITASQLDFEARVLLINAGGIEAAFAPLDHEVLTKSLNAVLDQRLATLEADKIDAYAVDVADVDKAINAFRARFATDERFRLFLERQEADMNDLGQVLRRSLRAQRAIDGRLRLKAQVSEAEARQYQAQHPSLKEQPLELVRQQLFTHRFQTLMRDELKAARKQADVRLLGPFAPLEGHP
jgi:hypothetical protein